MLRQIVDFLSKEKVQRIAYLLLIPLWTYIWYIDDLKEYPNKSLLDISWIIPTSILLFQVIFNNAIVWAILFTIFGLYGLAATFGSILSLIRGTEHVLGYSIFLICAIVGVWIFYFMKPVKGFNRL